MVSNRFTLCYFLFPWYFSKKKNAKTKQYFPREFHVKETISYKHTNKRSPWSKARDISHHSLIALLAGRSHQLRFFMHTFRLRRARFRSHINKGYMNKYKYNNKSKYNYNKSDFKTKNKYPSSKLEKQGFKKKILEKPFLKARSNGSNIIKHCLIVLDGVGRRWMKFDFIQAFHPTSSNIFVRVTKNTP